MINLKDVIQDTKTAEIEYPNCKGFMVRVGLVTRPMANKIRKDCTVTKMSERYSSMEETIDEENDSQDQNPANDITNAEIGADYLNPDVATEVLATKYREHSISQTYLVTLTVSQFDLTLISLDVLDFGVLENGALSNTRKETPDFN